MPRSYRDITIKELFGEASHCAYPGCDAPLIFRDRGIATAVAQIAHIRSESANGPRHDPDYTGDVNGPENLLLLCGTHHPPVDRHEQAYTVAELESWKAAQRASAGAGTPLSESDLRSYSRTTPEERQVLVEIARKAQRFAGACARAQEEIDALRSQAEQARRAAAMRFAGAMQVDDDGSRTPLDLDGVQLSGIEQRQWNARVATLWDAQRPRIEEARSALDEEVAVLRMFAGTLVPAAQLVSAAAGVALRQVGDPAASTSALHTLDGYVAQLWRVANGSADAEGLR